MRLNLPENSDSAEQREILDALPVLVFLEREGKIVFANVEARQMLGLAEGEWTECAVEEVLWGLFTGTAEPQTLLTGTRQGSPFHATLPAGNGRLLPIEGTYSLLNAERREAVIVAHPGGRELAPKPQLMEDVLASIPEAVAIVHEGHVLYTNPAFTQMFGYTAEEVSGSTLQELIVPETRRHEKAMLEEAVDRDGTATFETVRMKKDGELVDVSLLTGPLVVDGAKVGYVFTYREIGQRKEIEARLQHDAMHDELTGLPNRALFLDRVSLALSRGVRRRDQGCGILFLDLDRFKEINDLLGHAAGDVLLLAAADRLRAALRPQDSAARLGGDEFGVLVENILSVTDLEIVASRVSHEMQRPFDIFGHSVQASASIGVAMAGPDHTTPEMLIGDADFAMYRAKQEGGGRYEIFDKHMEVHVTNRQERERELRQVLNKRKFEIWYEPIHRLQSGKLEGYESQLCWRRADGSTDCFSDLLSVAEETGLSISLGRETLETVCGQLREWTDGLPWADLCLTVNVSQRQFYHPDLVAQLRSALTASGADPSRLLFEVPETTLSENPDAAVAILQRMVDCNVRIAVDEFGCSLAPLNHLVRLPIDVVKIDSRLTAAATTTGRQQAVLESLIHLSHMLGMQVIAQGIENQAQLDALARMGCELGQGPLLSLALDPERALQLAERGTWAVTQRF
jgi:diguanylate cyclase (GGDEF)-like protein/PAS domain S-box-containing protein